MSKATSPKEHCEGTVVMSPDGEKICSWKFPEIPKNETGSTTLVVSGETETTTTEEEVKDKAQQQEELTRHVRCILNKISPENFDKLSQDLASMLPTKSVDETFGAAVKLVLRCIL